FNALDQDRLNAIKGVLAQPSTMALAPSRTFAQAILGTVHEATAEDISNSKGKVVAGDVVGSGGLQSSFNAQLAGTRGMAVSLVPAPAAGAATDGATDSATADAGTPAAD